MTTGHQLRKRFADRFSERDQLMQCSTKNLRATAKRDSRSRLHPDLAGMSQAPKP